ncbi:MAG: ATP-binding protein [Planctomycetes bacterium]|nr:ATP-binding protein [Planctomycetota bacterium]
MPQSRTGPHAETQEKPGWQSAAVVSLVDMNHVIARILHHMTGAGYTDKEQFGVRLSLEEAIVNAIKHGNHEDPTKKVHVRFQITPFVITTEIEDEGTGFNPERVPNPLAPENIERPGGRGVFLMRHYMTSVQFNERGNRVILSKVRAR